jgi:hypothetical protein
MCSGMCAFRKLLCTLQLAVGISLQSAPMIATAKPATLLQLGARLPFTSKQIAGRSQPHLSLSTLDHEETPQGERHHALDHKGSSNGGGRRLSILRALRSACCNIGDRTLKQRLSELLRDLFCLLFWAGGWSLISSLGWDSTPAKSLVCLLVGAAGLFVL